GPPPVTAVTPLTGLDLPFLNVHAGTDLAISGSVTVTLTGVFTATAAGTLQLGQLTVTTMDSAAAALVTSHGIDASAGAAPIQAVTLDLAAAASGGPGSVAVTVKLVSLKQGARSWLGVDASGISLGLTVDPLTVSVTGGTLQLNKAAGAGASKLDWASFLH